MSCERFGSAIICGDDNNKKKCICGHVFREDYAAQLNSLDTHSWCINVVCPKCDGRYGIALCMIAGQVLCDIETGYRITT